MTLIAVDDEPLALVLIQKLARDTPDCTLLATFMIPMFYLLVESLGDKLGGKKKNPAANESH